MISFTFIVRNSSYLDISLKKRRAQYIINKFSIVIISLFLDICKYLSNVYIFMQFQNCNIISSTTPSIQKKGVAFAAPLTVFYYLPKYLLRRPTKTIPFSPHRKAYRKLPRGEPRGNLIILLTDNHPGRTYASRDRSRHPW